MAYVSEFVFEGFEPFRVGGKNHRFETGTLEVQDYMFTACMVRPGGKRLYQVDWLTTPNGLWDHRNSSFVGSVHLARIGDDVVLAYVNTNGELVRVKHLIDLIPEIAKERDREERKRLYLGAAKFLKVKRRKKARPQAQSSEEPKLRLVGGRDTMVDDGPKEKPKRISRKKQRKANGNATKN